MARMARVVILGIAHHVTQRGNRRQQTFFFATPTMRPIRGIGRRHTYSLSLARVVRDAPRGGASGHDEAAEGLL